MNTFSAIAVASLLATPAIAQNPNHQRMAQSVSMPAGTVLHPSLSSATGTQRLIVRLSHEAVAAYEIDLQPDMGAEIDAEQAKFISRCKGLPKFKVIASVSKVLNAVFINVDASALEMLAEDPAVTRVLPVSDYALDLSEVKPYVGSTRLQNLGFDGSGVSIAVLDSGIDYTHANLGGAGTLTAYEAAYGISNGDAANTMLDGLFPTAKVVGGFDFVGEDWPNTPEAPDPDPIDFQGHGTHVADIAGGLGGMAQGADLHAVKVCSAVASSCSGIALIQGMEYAVDPNGDGNTRDHVDIINMSLGSNYGTAFDDDLSAAVDNATKVGVLTVSSAGNGGDQPYITGSPSAAPTALAVAQTAVPSAKLDVMEVTAPAAAAGLYSAVFQAWSTPLTAAISGAVTYGDNAGGNLDGCAPFAPGSLSGIVVVDRGACAFSAKIFNIQEGGGALGIIGLVAPGAPFSGGFGGGGPFTISGFMISQVDGDILRAGGAVVNFDPANGISLVGSTISSSSRGPAMGSNLLKPEIGAPGASLSAQAGTGTGETTFGGTSGASPVVAGIAAQLLEARRLDIRQALNGRAAIPRGLKALLVTSGARNTLGSDVGANGGSLAPISRIGGGEVRAQRAFFNPLIITEKKSKSPVLSFGHINVTKTKSFTKTLVITNTTLQRLTYSVNPRFRFADDRMSGAISIHAPSTVRLKPFQTKEIRVRLTVNPANLPGNSLNSGSDGALGDNMTATEYDGYVVFAGPGRNVAVPWHMVPMKSANVRAPSSVRVRETRDKRVRLRNRGEGIAQLQDYSLLALSPNIPQGAVGAQSPTPDIRAFGYRTFAGGGCSAGFGMLFFVNTWERQTHLVPVSHQVTIDIDQDGTDDYLVLNRDFTLNNVTDGRQLTWVVDLATGDAGAFFFAEHATNTGNTTMVICGEQIGLDDTAIASTLVDVSLEATDFYFGGPGDSVGPFTIAPGGDQFSVSDGAGGVAADVAGNSNGDIYVGNAGFFPGTTGELGIVLQTNSDRGAGNRGAATQSTEALTILVSP